MRGIDLYLMLFFGKGLNIGRLFVVVGFFAGE